MNKSTTVSRITIIAALCCIAYIGLFAEPNSESNSAWIITFIISKGIGAIAAWAAIRLVNYWKLSLRS